MLASVTIGEKKLKAKISKNYLFENKKLGCVSELSFTV